MVCDKANHYGVGMDTLFGEVGIVEVIPIADGSADRCDLGHAAVTRSGARDFLVEQGVIHPMHEEGVSEDHDSGLFVLCHRIDDLREGVNVFPVVVENRRDVAGHHLKDDDPEDDCDDDLPFGLPKTGNR